jgi:hypothetical protein
VAHVVSQTTVSGQATAPKWGSNIEIPVCRVVRPPDEAFSTHTTLRKCGPTFQIGYRRRDAARIGARQVHSRRLREIEMVRRVPDTAGSGAQPGAPQYDARSDSHCSEAFPPLAQSYLSWTRSYAGLRWYPPRPALATKGPAADVAQMTR